MKESTRQLLERCIDFGKTHPGHGYSLARMVRQALEDEDREYPSIDLGADGRLG